MSKVIICLIISCVFSFLSYDSFMSNDYRPLQNWFAYYKEYRELQGALNKGNADKTELLEKLKQMYPEKAKQWETVFKDKYGDLQKETQSVESSVSSQSHTEESDQPRKTVSTPQTQKQSRTDSVRSNNQNNQNNQSNTTKQ